ncbi:MAG: carbohydrate binding family 9 domain-containing protein [Acidobacteria bacterium]|nr:carbohydrate binding family 9 domain-containing protein [Acidobacteriota bacterium]
MIPIRKAAVFGLNPGGKFLSRFQGRANLFWLAVGLVFPTILWAQLSGPKKVVTAIFTESKITIDGELDEPVWQTAQPATDFIQRDPTEGVPASERTEVRVLYDRDNLYIGAYCYDRTPERILIHDITRDFVINQQDNIGIILDTFNDDRSGFSMDTTPAGGQQDLQVLDETKDVNFNWDGVWYVQTRIQKDGWTAEFAIPFKTLRFSKEKKQIWGIQFFRRIRRRGELSWWTPVPRRFTGWYLSPAGELQGLEGIRQGRNLKVKPYLLAGVKRFESRGTGTKKDLDGGLDVKYGLTPGLTLDLTVNTDFSQVEADTQQVNLTRFPLFFPEKRDFFLENAGIFELGENYSAGVSRTEEVIPFFSRRIGLSAAREPLPILGGVRLTGRTGPYYLGLLDIQTRSEGTTAANNFAVGRIRRDFMGNSDAGVMFINRQSGQANDYNRLIGGDVNLRFSRDLKMNAVLAQSRTPGLHGADGFGKVEMLWQTNLIRVLGSYMDVQKNFKADVGFVRRPGRRILHNELGLRPRLNRETRVGSFLREIFPLVISDYAILPDGKTETKLLQPQLRLEFQDGSTIETRFARTFERLTGPFRIRPDKNITIPAGDYPFHEFLLSYSGNKSKALSGNASFSKGDFFTGRKKTLILGASLQPGYHFSTSVNYQRDEVKLREGSFSTNLVNWKINYSFNPRMFLNALFQYNSDTHAVNSNIRFRLIHHPLSDLFVVYNEQRDVRGKQSDRAISLKYTYLFNF